jgi:hypothetical protein
MSYKENFPQTLNINFSCYISNSYITVNMSKLDVARHLEYFEMHRLGNWFCFCH